MAKEKKESVQEEEQFEEVTVGRRILTFNFFKTFFEIIARLVLVLLVMKASNGNIEPIVSVLIGVVLMTWAIIPLAYIARSKYIESTFRRKIE